jgi:putative ABC transport system permease protein
MNLTTQFRMWARDLFHAKRSEHELDAELRFDFTQRIEANVRAGMSRQEAEREARREFGSIALTKEECRDARGTQFFQQFWQDVRFGLRMLRKNPGFTTVAILTLALGIGANTAIFSVVDAVLLRSLPFRDAGRLVAISETHASLPELGASAADFAAWQAQSHSFSELAAYNLTSIPQSTLVVTGTAQEVRGVIISANLFPLLGIAPAMGRNFLPEEDKLGSGPVAILSGEIWKTSFNSDPNIVGRALDLNQQTYTIVGVLPPQIRFPQNADVWLPLGNLDKESFANRFYHPLFAVGRLASGASVSLARTEMEGIAAQLASVNPQTNRGIGVKVEPILDKYISGLRSALLVLWAAVGLVLLIACANVASLLYARSTSRESEMALRHALGANRARLIRQGLTESVVLAGLGGMLGLLLAKFGMLLLSSWLPQMLDTPILRLHPIGIDPQVLAMTFAISIVSGILFGILPSIRASRSNSGSLQSGYRNSPSVRRRLAHRVTVAAEVAIAVIVLISGGLLARSLQQLIATSPGFRVDHLLTLRIALPSTKYNSTQTISGFYQQLLTSLRGLPGVEAVGTIDQTPLVPSVRATRFLVDGAAPIKPGDFPVANARQVNPDYFRSAGVPLLNGRFVNESDMAHPDELKAVLINHTLAEHFFPGQNPIGRKLLLDVTTATPVSIPIVGVVGDVRDVSIDSPAPAEMYFAGFGRVSTFVVRTASDPPSVTETIRNAVLSIDPSQPIFEVQTATQLVDHSIARQRFAATLLGLFSLLALILAAGGIYGVTSYAVVARTREIGVRMALGAQPSDVLQMILRQEMFGAAIGIVIGSVCALAATKLLSSMLYQVAPTDPMTYAGVCLALGSAAFLACYIPARRAMRVDPMTALRFD